MDIDLNEAFRHFKEKEFRLMLSTRKYQRKHQEFQTFLLVVFYDLDAC